MYSSSPHFIWEEKTIWKINAMQIYKITDTFLKLHPNQMTFDSCNLGKKMNSIYIRSYVSTEDSSHLQYLRCLRNTDHWKAHKHMNNYPEFHTVQSIQGGYGWEATHWAWWVNPDNHMSLSHNQFAFLYLLKCTELIQKCKHLSGINKADHL